MKHKFGEQITKKIVGLKAKAYSYLKDENDADKKVKKENKKMHNKKNS